MPRSSRLDARPLPSSGFRIPEFRRIGNSRCEALRAGGRQAPGVLHHVMGRGIERKRLFIDKRDGQDFNTRLAALAFEKLCTFCTSPFYKTETDHRLS